MNSPRKSVFLVASLAVVVALASGPVSAKKDNNNGNGPNAGVQLPVDDSKPFCSTAKKVASDEPTFIVRFLGSAKPNDIKSALGKINGSRKDFVNGKVGSLSVVKFSATRGRANAKKDLETLSGIIDICEEDQVIDVKPLSVVSAAAVKLPAKSWGLDRIDQRSRTYDNSYSYATTGAGVNAYVVDTGVLSTHTDLLGRVQTGFDATESNSTEDCNGHGTHVAGTIAGTTYGVAPAATVVPVRVLKCDGSGTLSGVIAGIDWAIADHAKTPNVRAVMNLSLGGGSSLSLNEAVTRATQAGITVIAAAGNSTGADACDYSPAGADRNEPTKPHVVITVGATTSTDTRASYSNIGQCVDLFAPGSAITSAWYTSTTATQTISGTSMAAPHVAGVAARVLSSNPTFTPAQVAAVIKTNATANVVVDAQSPSNLLLFADPDATVVTPPATTGENVGGGTGETVVPTAPDAPFAVAGDRSAFVKWSDNNEGSSAITGHSVRVYSGTRLIKEVAGTSSTNATVTGLKAGTTYTFRVAAVNAAGRSSFSEASNAVTPVRIVGNKQPAAKAESVATSVPGSAQKVRARVNGKRIIASWRYAQKDVGVNTNFAVSVRDNKGLVARLSVSDWQGVTIAGLKPGTYSVRVRAFNQVGSAKASKALTVRIR